MRKALYFDPSGMSSGASESGSTTTPSNPKGFITSKLADGSMSRFIQRSHT